MENPYEVESNDSHGYVCQDCRYFQSGRCAEEDEGGEICSRFKTAIEKEGKENEFNTNEIH